MNKRGYTLVEVLTSIVVVGIVFLAMTSMLISSAKINKKLLIKENIVSEIENINNLFSSNPTKFEEFLNQVYEFEILDDKFTIYYDSRYVMSDYKTKNHIDIIYTKENGSYSITINVYHDDELSVEYSNLTRTIRME